MGPTEALAKICGLAMRFDEETLEKSRAMDVARMDALRAGMQNGQEGAGDGEVQSTAPGNEDDEVEEVEVERRELDGIDGLAALAFDLAESFETGNADLEKNVALFNGLHPMQRGLVKRLMTRRQGRPGRADGLLRADPSRPTPCLTS